MSEPTQQQGLTAAAEENEGLGPSPETVVFGSDARPEEFVATLARETEAALLEGLAGLPGDVDRPQALVETIMDPYKKKMDVLERYCRGSVFSIGMYDRDKQRRVVAALLRHRADPESTEFLLGDACRLPATEGSVVDVPDGGFGAAVPASADEIPTDEQFSAAQDRVANLRAHLERAMFRRDELALQVDEWRSVQARAVAAAAENAEGPALLPPLGADDAAIMHDVVSSVVVGASTLADLHQQGEELLSRLQEKSSDSGDGMDEEEGTSAAAAAAVAADLPKAKTLEEKYAEDRAAIDCGGGGGSSSGGGAAAAPSAAVKQLLRLLRTGKENSETPFQAAP